jgi:cytoskeletal protein CcmA (bactofilin family)
MKQRLEGEVGVDIINRVIAVRKGVAFAGKVVICEKEYAKVKEGFLYLGNQSSFLQVQS